MKKIAVIFGLFLLVAILVVPVTTSGNYSPSNSSVERNVGAFVADGSPRPPTPPIIVADGSPRPPTPQSPLLMVVHDRLRLRSLLLMVVLAHP
jgi:hypothetical protein